MEPNLTELESFHAAIGKDSDGAKSRAALISWRSDGGVTRRKFDRTIVWNGKSILKALHDVLKNAPPNSSRLLILENINQDLVEGLGKELHIPEEVFYLHWVHPNDHILGKARIPLGEDPRKHFILNYRQPLPFQSTERYSKEPQPLNCVAQRTIVRQIRSRQKHALDDADQAEQLVSFYRATYLGHDIAVLLLDPCPTHEQQFGGSANSCVPKPHPPLSKIRSEEAREASDDDEAIRPIAAANVDEEKSSSLSIYDELLASDWGTLTWSEMCPDDWTFQCRRIVLAKTAAVVQAALVETGRLTHDASSGVKRMAEFDFKNKKQEAWTDEWKGDFFTQLWELREDLELMHYRLELDRRTLERIRGRSSSIPEHLKDQVELDMQEWVELRKTSDYAFQLMERTTNTYVQTVGATGTQFANEQAKNSRKLTGFAAVFVPASLCAAILAIPSFSPEEKSPIKFWVFWVVSVPVAFILGLWFLTPIPQKVQDRWKKRAKAQSEEDLKEKALMAPSGAEVFGSEIKHGTTGIRQRWFHRSQTAHADVEKGYG